jgi:ribA/ribD-fused uncharacterized protein
VLDEAKVRGVASPGKLLQNSDRRAGEESMKQVTINRFKGDHEFLSNFYPCEIIFEGSSFSSVEHAYQAAKTLDGAERAMVRSQPTAGRAKRAGRRITVRDDWDQVRLEVMLQLLRAKFSDPLLGSALRLTGASPLVEGNRWHDTFWGICTDCRSGCEGVGENWLGRLLVQVRDELSAPVS